MALAIEDYALIGDLSTAALVGKDGSIDWLCWPRFDSAACFAALLGTPENGRWRIGPTGQARVARRYRDGSMVLETEFTTAEGRVRVVDAMSRLDAMSRPNAPSTLIRVIEGVSGAVPMRMDLTIRFDYGSIVPWVNRAPDACLQAIAGPDMVVLRSDVPVHGEEMSTVADFTVKAGEEVVFSLTYSASHLPAPEAIDVRAMLRSTENLWRGWSGRIKSCGDWSEAVARSVMVLKALTYHPTGGILAAPTTSLPERVGGPRNWDYRFCWLRDSTFTLLALLNAGFQDEAVAWRAWLLRAVAGSPDQIRSLYGIAGERHRHEWEIEWLAGYEGSRPVRAGNAAAEQLQLDVYGEIMDSLHQARHCGIEPDCQAWALQRQMLEHLGGIWQQPDDSIWEVRSGARQFTYSKAMAWVAYDRAVRECEKFGMEGPVDEWRSLRDRIHRDVCEHGFDRKRNSFVQAYGAKELDASLLLLPLVGFLPPDDPRIVGTVAAIERELAADGLVMRYDSHRAEDGLPAGEGAFLPCTFWLADNYVLQGRHDEARERFEHLLSLRNDVGLLAEEYDPRAKRQLGNFPQAFSHVALVNTGHNLARAEKPAEQRSSSPPGD